MSILAALSSLFELVGTVLIGEGMTEIDYHLMYGAYEARRREECHRQEEADWWWWGGPRDGYYADEDERPDW